MTLEEVEQQEALGSIALWFHMYEIQNELTDNIWTDDKIILSFMGSGGSHMVSVGTLRKAFPRPTTEGT